MPARRQRSRSYKQRQVRTPGGRMQRIYKEKRKGAAACASCSKTLGGVPRPAKGNIGSIPRSSRMPNRPFGGYLCPACSRRVMKEKARA
ncbi:MAG: 50S ribosomal protein L34e [Methanobacteriota archaeon]